MPQQPNMNQMLKQVQKMQADMMAAQEKLKDEEVQGSAGGGAVKVTITGDLVIKQVYIDPSAIDPEDLKLSELFARVENAPADAPVREVVLATNPTTTGEATALYVADRLRTSAPEVTVTRLASGLPVGADLEYADEVTLGKALAGRRAL